MGGKKSDDSTTCQSFIFLHGFKEFLEIFTFYGLLNNLSVCSLQKRHVGGNQKAFFFFFKYKNNKPIWLHSAGLQRSSLENQVFCFPAKRTETPSAERDLLAGGLVSRGRPAVLPPSVAEIDGAVGPEPVTEY